MNQYSITMIKFVHALKWLFYLISSLKGEIKMRRTLSGESNPAIMRRIVDFPVPEGPMMPTASPW